VAVVTLPTPRARDGKGPGHQYGLPDLIEAGRSPAAMLPTPTSGGGTGYMNGNRRDTRRPTLELAVQGYLPTGSPSDRHPAGVSGSSPVGTHRRDRDVVEDGDIGGAILGGPFLCSQRQAGHSRTDDRPGRQREVAFGHVARCS
jgi:hypothetical protein